MKRSDLALSPLVPPFMSAGAYHGCRPKWNLPAWVTWLVLAFGVLLRAGTAIVTIPEQANDDHFEPVKILLQTGRLPDAGDCWECYQPPLYYLVAAGVYEGGRSASAAFGKSPNTAHQFGRKCVQFISVAAGAATLFLCVGIARLAWPPRPPNEALLLSLVAFLPVHIQMSAMESNDALTYALAAAAVFAACKFGVAAAAVSATSKCSVAAPYATQDREKSPPRAMTSGAHSMVWLAISGLLAGATVLTKLYGATVVVAIGLTLALACRRCRAPHRWRPLFIFTTTALLVSIWPSVRNLATFERPIVDNYDFFDTPMRFQPPGSLRETSFLSFRFAALLHRPWVHMSHADSLPTELYGRLWFEYEGLRISQVAWPGWRAYWDRLRAEQPQWDRSLWVRLLSYDEPEMSPVLANVGRVSYVAGLLPTAIVLIGAAAALIRRRGAYAPTLLALTFLLALAAPLVQTLRVPYFSAMKTAFTLCGVCAVPPLAAEGLDAFRRPALRRALAALLWLCMLAIAAAQTVFLIEIARLSKFF